MEKIHYLNKMAKDAVRMKEEADNNFKEIIKQLSPADQLLAKKVYADSLRNTKNGNQPSINDIIKAFKK